MGWGRQAFRKFKWSYWVPQKRGKNNISKHVTSKENLSATIYLAWQLRPSSCVSSLVFPALKHPYTMMLPIPVCITHLLLAIFQHVYCHSFVLITYCWFNMYLHYWVKQHFKWALKVIIAAWSMEHLTRDYLLVERNGNSIKEIFSSTHRIRLSNRHNCISFILAIILQLSTYLYQWALVFSDFFQVF